MITDTDIKHLRRCVELAGQAVDAGDEPFGSVLVSVDGTVLAEDRNRIHTTGDGTRHPEFTLARWSAENLPPAERLTATVYTSGEHCPMCAAAHGWVGLGRIVYASSSEQLAGWLRTMGVQPSKVRRIAIEEVIRDAVIEGPAPELAGEIRQLHARRHGKAD
jgi:tRNA(Arg) A34 adenosine deaminase TadA